MSKDGTQYPMWIYNAAGDSKLVKSLAEHKAAGAGWKESPADVKKDS
jgi:hypothetical protein